MRANPDFLLGMLNYFILHDLSNALVVILIKGKVRRTRLKKQLPVLEEVWKQHVRVSFRSIGFAV
jgi:hypothetical protein